MRFSHRIILLFAALSASLPLLGQPVALVATYEFQNSLNARQQAAPTLQAVDPTGRSNFLMDTVLGTQRTVYQISSSTPNQNGGLTLVTPGLLSQTSYSVEMLFAFTEGNSSWRRVLDAEDRSTDRGLYLNTANRFEFYAQQSGSFSYQTGGYVHLVVTVSGNLIRTFVNGTQDMEFSNSSMNITNPRGLLHFFLDNSSGGGTHEFASARIALLRVYNNAVSAADAAQLARNPFSASVGLIAPSFAAADVRNGATFSAETPIAPGAFFSILGTALCDVTSDWTGRFVGNVAPTTLNGTRVLLDGRPAFISFTSPGQINAIAPEGIGATVSLVVERNGIPSNPVTIATRNVNPSFFTYDQRNRRYIATVAADSSAYIAPADLFGVTSINGLAVRPARPGEYVIAYGMGLGRTNPAIPAGQIPPTRDGGHPVTGAISLRLGGQPTQPFYVGLSSFAGVYIVVFQVPALAAGDYELSISIDGVSSPTGVNIPVQP